MGTCGNEGASVPSRGNDGCSLSERSSFFGGDSLSLGGRVFALNELLPTE